MKVSTCPPAAVPLQRLLAEFWPDLTWRMSADDCGVQASADFSIEPVPFDGAMGLEVLHYTEAGEAESLTVHVVGAQRILFSHEADLGECDLRYALTLGADEAEDWLERLVEVIGGYTRRIKTPQGLEAA